jgi:hypothetical protein
MNDLEVRTDCEKEISRLHAEINAHAQQTVVAALRIGQLLNAQKARLGHGAFMPWVKENLPFTHKTATTYMALYYHESIIRRKLETLSNFTLMDAYALVAEKRPVTPSVARKRMHKALLDDHRRESPAQEIFEAEIVVKAEPEPTPAEPPAPEVTRERREPSYGMQYAKMAVSQLKRVFPNDPERDAAFDYVVNWIAKQRAPRASVNPAVNFA